LRSSTAAQEPAENRGRLHRAPPIRAHQIGHQRSADQRKRQRNERDAGAFAIEQQSASATRPSASANSPAGLVSAGIEDRNSGRRRCRHRSCPWCAARDQSARWTTMDAVVQIVATASGSLQIVTGQISWQSPLQPCGARASLLRRSFINERWRTVYANPQRIGKSSRFGSGIGLLWCSTAVNKNDPYRSGCAPRERVIVAACLRAVAMLIRGAVSGRAAAGLDGDASVILLPPCRMLGRRRCSRCGNGAS